MLTNLPQYIAYTRKAIIQLIGLASALLALGLLPDKYAAWVAGAIAFLTTVSHYLTGNGSAPGAAEANEDFDPNAEDEDLGEEVPDEWKPAALITPGEIAANNEIAAPPDAPLT